MAKSYQDYQKEIAELQKKAEEARRVELADAIAQIKSVMKQFNLTIEDLKLKDGKKISRASGKAVVAKYRDPVSGETWTGRGRSPIWAAKAKAENKLDLLLIAQSPKPDAAPAASRKTAGKKSATKPAVKPAIKKPIQKKSPAKSAEPKAAAATSQESSGT